MKKKDIFQTDISFFFVACFYRMIKNILYDGNIYHCIVYDFVVCNRNIYNCIVYNFIICNRNIYDCIIYDCIAFYRKIFIRFLYHNLQSFLK